LGFEVWGMGFGFGVWGLGIGVWGLGFGVWGLGFGRDEATRWVRTCECCTAWVIGVTKCDEM